MLLSYSNNSNYFTFNDASFISIYNILKWIYSNFTENLGNLDIEIINEMIDFLTKYKANSLLNILVSVKFH